MKSMHSTGEEMNWRDLDEVPFTDDEVPEEDTDSHFTPEHGYIPNPNLGNFEETMKAYDKEMSLGRKKDGIHGRNSLQQVASSDNGPVGNSEPKTSKRFTMGDAMVRYHFTREDYERVLNSDKYENDLEAMERGLRIDLEDAMLLKATLEGEDEENEKRKAFRRDVDYVMSGLPVVDEKDRAEAFLNALEIKKQETEVTRKDESGEEVVEHVMRYPYELINQFLIAYGVMGDPDDQPEEVINGLVVMAERFSEKFMGSDNADSANRLKIYLNGIISSYNNDNHTDWGHGASSKK